MNKLECKKRLVEILTEIFPTYPEIEPDWVFKKSDEIYSRLSNEGYIKNMSFPVFHQSMTDGFMIAQVKTELGGFNVN